VIRVSRVSRVCVSFVCHGVSFIETQTAPPGGFESAVQYFGAFEASCWTKSVAES
jgi:hypothetical protein